MQNNVRVLAESQTLSHNQGSERNEFTKENFALAISENRKLKEEVIAAFNKSRYHQDQCIEIQGRYIKVLQELNGSTGIEAYMKVAI